MNGVEKKCPVCGKVFWVEYPDMWAYRKISHRITFFCSWKCLRDEEFNGGKKSMGRITQEEREKAIQAAIAGKDPMAVLEDCGSSDPGQLWYQIRKKLKAEDPDTWEMIPEKWKSSSRAKDVKPMAEPANEPEKEPEKPVFEYRMTGITTEIGDIQYYRRTGYVDWSPLDGNGPVSLNLEEWRDFLKIMPEAMKVLGVDL